MTKQRSGASLLFDRLILGHPVVVIICLAAAAGFFAFQARGFRLDASAETLVLENDEDLRYSRLISSRYEQQDFLVLAYVPKGDLLSEETLAALARLRDELQNLERVSSVLSILDVPLLESPPRSRSRTSRVSCRLLPHRRLTGIWPGASFARANSIRTFW